MAPRPITFGSLATQDQGRHEGPTWGCGRGECFGAHMNDFLEGYARQLSSSTREVGSSDSDKRSAR
jgi:hypothetical protein